MTLGMWACTTVMCIARLRAAHLAPPPFPDPPSQAAELERLAVWESPLDTKAHAAVACDWPTVAQWETLAAAAWIASPRLALALKVWSGPCDGVRCAGQGTGCAARCMQFVSAKVRNSAV